MVFGDPGPGEGDDEADEDEVPCDCDGDFVDRFAALTGGVDFAGRVSRGMGNLAGVLVTIQYFQCNDMNSWASLDLPGGIWNNIELCSVDGDEFTVDNTFDCCRDSSSS